MSCIKFFVGVHLTSHLAHQLEKSASWSEAQFEEKQMVRATFDRQEYFGMWLTEEQPQVEGLDVAAAHVTKFFATHCEEVDAAKLSLYVFAQQLYG